MEGGTTVAALVDALPDQHISVVTNSLPIALRMRARRPVLPVRVLGGWLSAVSGNTTGPEALKMRGAGPNFGLFSWRDGLGRGAGADGSQSAGNRSETGAGRLFRAGGSAYGFAEISPRLRLGDDPSAASARARHRCATASRDRTASGVGGRACGCCD